MRTTKRIEAGPAPSMPGHLRFAEQITRKYGFATRNYLGPQALTLLEPGEGDSAVQHVSLVQLTLHLRLQLQLLKQEERDMFRTYRRTLHLLEKLALRHDVSERKGSSFSPAGGGTSSWIAAANSATGTTRANHRQESKALRSDIGETKRANASSSAPLGARRHAPTNGESAGSRNSADAGIMRSIPAGPIVHPIRRIRGRGMREPVALRRDFRFAERSDRRHNERVWHVPADQVRQAGRKPESKAMALLRTRDAAAEIRERRDERKRDLQQGTSPGEGGRSPLLEREWREPEQKQGQVFVRVLEWKRVSLQQQGFNPVHIHRTTQLFSVMADDVSAQTKDRSIRARGRLEKASSPVDSDDKKGYRSVSESRGGHIDVRPIMASASPIDDDDKRHRTLGEHRGRSTDWKNRGTASVAGRSWLRPKGISSLGMEILLQHGIGLFEAGFLGGHRTPDARFENSRIRGSRQTDAAAAAFEGRLFELWPLHMAVPAKFSATSSVRDISDFYETAILSSALIRSFPGMLMNRYWPCDFWSTATVFERTHRQKANTDIIYGRAPFLVQRKAGNEASASLLFHFPTSVSLRRDDAFISRSPGRSSNKFGGSGSVLMLAGAVPSIGISVVKYDSSARSDGFVPFRSRMLLMSNGQLYHRRIAEAESAEMTAEAVVPARRERSSLVAVQSKWAAAKNDKPMTNVSGVNIVSSIAFAIRSSVVEGQQFRRHPLPIEGRAASIGPQIYAADSIGAVKQRYARRHQASRSASATTSGKNARHDANDEVKAFAGETVRGFTGGTVSGSANPVIRSYTDGAVSAFADTVHRSTPDMIRESEGWGWNLTDVPRHPVVPAQYEQSRFLSVHSFMFHKPVSLHSEGGLSALFPKITDFAGKIAASRRKRDVLKDGAEGRTISRHPAGQDAMLFKRSSAVYPSAPAGSMAPTAPVAQIRAISLQRAKTTGQVTVSGPAAIQTLPGTSPRMATTIASKLSQVRADWSFAVTVSASGALLPHTPQRPLEPHPSQVVAGRQFAIPANVPSVLSPGSPQRPLQLHRSQADLQRSPAMPASASGVLSPGSPQRPFQLHRSQVDAQGSSAMPKNAPGVLSLGTPYRPFQLHRSQADLQRSPAMPTSALGVLSPGSPQRPLQLHRSQADLQRSPAMHASASGVLSPGSPQRSLQLHPSQTVASRTSAMPASASGVLSPRALYRPLQLHPSQAVASRPSAIPARTSGVLSPRAPQRTLQLHRSQTDEQRQHAMPARGSGTQPPQAASLPLQLHRPQAIASRPPAMPASAAGALTLRATPQARTAQQPAKATAVPSPSYRAVRSEIEYHKKQKPDTGTLAKQAAAQAVSQVSAQLEAMKIELSNASQAALPDLDRFVDQVYRELENKIKFERQRSGL